MLPSWEFIYFYFYFVCLSHCVPFTSYLSHFQALEKAYTAHTLYITERRNCTNISLDLQLFIYLWLFIKQTGSCQNKKKKKAIL